MTTVKQLNIVQKRLGINNSASTDLASVADVIFQTIVPLLSYMYSIALLITFVAIKLK